MNNGEIKMDKEIGLFVIWENALYMKEKIVNDIYEKFTVLNIFCINWDKEKIIENYERYYGKHMQELSLNEKGYKLGKCMLIIVHTTKKYDWRKTSHGDDYVNVNMFDAKMKYRDWTGGGHKIHGSNSLAETNHDLKLLLGFNVNEYIEVYGWKKKSEIIILNQNIYSVSNINSEDDLFCFFNDCIDYALFPIKNNRVNIIFLKNPLELALLIDSQYSVNVPYIYCAKMDVYFIYFSYRNRIIDKRWYEDIYKRKVFRNNRYWVEETDTFMLELYYYYVLNSYNEYAIYDLQKNMSFHVKKDLEAFLKRNNYKYLIHTSIDCYFNRNVKPKSIEVKLRKKDMYIIKQLFVNCFHKLFECFYKIIIDYFSAFYFYMSGFLIKHEVKKSLDNSLKLYSVQLIRKYGKRLGTKFFCVKCRNNNYLLKGYDFNKTYLKEKKIYKKMFDCEKINMDHYFQILNYKNKNDKYLLMPLYNGKRLDEILNYRKLTSKECDLLYEFSLEVLEELLTIQVVHRDIRPENIFCFHNYNGDIEKFKLYDFAYSVYNGSEHDGFCFKWRIKNNLGSVYRASNYYWDDAISFYNILIKASYDEDISKHHDFNKLKQYVELQRNRFYINSYFEKLRKSVYEK